MEPDDLVDGYLTKTAELLDTIEGKVRHVRDPDFWGKPYGTPITPGMKPTGKPGGPGVRVPRTHLTGDALEPDDRVPVWPNYPLRSEHIDALFGQSPNQSHARMKRELQSLFDNGINEFNARGWRKERQEYERHVREYERRKEQDKVDGMSGLTPREWAAVYKDAIANATDALDKLDEPKPKVATRVSIDLLGSYSNDELRTHRDQWIKKRGMGKADARTIRVAEEQIGWVDRILKDRKAD